MDRLDDIVEVALKRYYNALEVLGYKDNCSVEKLVVLTYIDDFINSSASKYITEEDRRVIANSLYCMFGTTCLIPFPDQIVSGVTSKQ